MQSRQFYDELNDNYIWQKIKSHPFVTGIADGSLSKKKYEFFLKQDYLYLIEFAKLLALAVVKADNPADMSYFSNLLDVTLNTEMDLHRQTCNEFGISTDELLTTQPAMITVAYTNFLLKAGYEGSFEDILAVLLPCAAGYEEIASHLLSQGAATKDKFYQQWLEMYSSEGYRSLVAWLIERMNKAAKTSSAKDRDRWHRLYLTSARFEYLFFEMSWKCNFWFDES
jgi:thiaminase/transcriptional activator TenA